MTSKRSTNRRSASFVEGVPAETRARPREFFPTGREKARGDVVLIVERDPPPRRALYEGLGAAGYRSVTACDQLHAEDVLREIDQHLSLALVDDESWPLTASTRAALQQRWPTLPIVVMLESADPVLEQRASAHGAIEVLTKPFDLPEVVRLADRLTGHRRPCHTPRFSLSTTNS
jgi:DNA-binding NtrC family response regulator